MFDKLLHPSKKSEPSKSEPKKSKTSGKISLDDLLEKWRAEVARLQNEPISSENPRPVVDAKLLMLGNCINELQGYMDASK